MVPAGVYIRRTGKQTQKTGKSRHYGEVKKGAKESVLVCPGRQMARTCLVLISSPKLSGFKFCLMIKYWGSLQMEAVRSLGL